MEERDKAKASRPTNRRRWRIVAVLCALLIGAVVVAWWTREREPRYKGVPLTAWLCTYDSYFGSGNFPTTSQMEDAAEAVRHIGTNALPFLLRWMCDEPAPWRIKWRIALEKLPHPADRLGRLTDRRIGPGWELRHRLALYGFTILGPDASPAIPELIRLQRATNSPLVSQYAGIALSRVQGDRLSLNLATLADAQAPPLLRAFAAHSIALIGTNTPAVQSTLVRALEDQDAIVRLYATNALRNFPPEVLAR